MAMGAGGEGGLLGGLFAGGKNKPNYLSTGAGEAWS
jgi:hypothetical protein